jgi:hypothetical protein
MMMLVGLYFVFLLFTSFRIILTSSFVCIPYFFLFFLAHETVPLWFERDQPSR